MTEPEYKKRLSENCSLLSCISEHWIMSIFVTKRGSRGDISFFLVLRNLSPLHLPPLNVVTYPIRGQTPWQICDTLLWGDGSVLCAR